MRQPQSDKDMTTCHGVSLENVVECVQDIYSPYLLCILKGAPREQHILVGGKQSAMREGTQGDSLYLVAVQQCKQVPLEGSEGACGVRWLSGSPEGKEPLLYLERGGGRMEER